MKVTRKTNQPGSVKEGAAEFVALAATTTTLYALDAVGGVWLYKPAEGTRFAFWAHLTKYRVDNTKSRSRTERGQD